MAICEDCFEIRPQLNPIPPSCVAMKVKVHDNKEIHPSQAVRLVPPESSRLTGPCRMRGAISNTGTSRAGFSHLALSFLCFLKPSVCFFSLWTVMRGISKLTDPRHTRPEELREKKFPAFHFMNRSPAVSPLGDTLNSEEQEETADPWSFRALKMLVLQWDLYLYSANGLKG